MPQVIGLDFGTTNSAIAVATAGREAELVRFGQLTSFRSILYFPHRDRTSSVKPETKAGPEAMSSYLDADTKGRLILSTNPIWRVVYSPPHKSMVATSRSKI